MTLESALAAVIAVRDCPATRRLCLDCWLWAKDRPEAEGLSYAAMLLEGVRRYAEHERAVKDAAAWLRVPSPSGVGG